MKIQPIQIWKNGELQEASWLNCQAVSDNLKNAAVFQYSLYSMSSVAIPTSPYGTALVPATILAEGTLVMNGTDYEGWETNEYAWNWVVTKLGLTLAPEESQPSE